jgi:hypothetical protein
MTGARYFDEFVPTVRQLCDQIYEQHDLGTSRRDTYHELGISLVEGIVAALDKPRDDVIDTVSDLDEFIKKLNEEYGNATSTALTGLEFDVTIDPASLCGLAESLTVPTVIMTPPEATRPQTSVSQNNGLVSNPESGELCRVGDVGPLPSQSTQQGGETCKVEANAYCEVCGYRPKGDPQWFKGSMAKHKKLQHSSKPPRIYKCPFPGCSSQYKNRPDNLRQHQIEKNHWVAGDEKTVRRPSKRKKVSLGDDEDE